jgi:hypothetical protein
MDPYTQAAVITGGASLLGGVVGGTSDRATRKNMRKQYEYEKRYRPGINTAIMRSRMQDAQELGIHPLVMMGIDPGGAGGFTGFDSQSNIGDGIARAGEALGTSIIMRENKKISKLEEERVQAEIDLLKAQATNLGQKPPSQPISGMYGQTGPRGSFPDIDPTVQEQRKAEVLPYSKAVPHQGLGEKPLTNAFNVGDQKIHFMAEESSDISEDPAWNLAVAFFDRSNEAVDWRKAIRDFAGVQEPRDYKARNLAERKITKRFLWGLVKISKHYKIPKYMGR